MSKTTGLQSDMITTERSSSGDSERQEEPELIEGGDIVAENEDRSQENEDDGAVILNESQEASAIDDNAVINDSDNQNVEDKCVDVKLTENTNLQESDEKAAIRPPHPSRRTVQDLEVGSKIKKASSTCTGAASQPGAFFAGAFNNIDTAIESECAIGPATLALGCPVEGRAEETKEEEDSLPQHSQDNDINSNTVNEAISAPRKNHAEVEEVPMIQAELVTPPIQAVQVIYDEHPEAHIDPEHGKPSNMDPRNRNNTGPITSSDDNEDVCIMDNLMSKRMQRKIGPWLCLLSIFLSVLIPVSIHFSEKSKERETTTTHSETDSVAETMAPSYPYECFTSTKEMIASQIHSPEQLLFIMCPNTRIKLGVLANPTANDTRIVNGDAPIMVLRENIEVRCGRNGNVNNDCIMDGGFVQVLLQPQLFSDREGQEVIAASRPTNNVTIRGITFTGQLVSDYTLGGSSIVVSNPGHGVQMVDCLWENMTAPSGLLFVGTNPFQMFSGTKGIEFLELHSASLSVINSTFRNITYDGVLVEATRQELSLKGCQFENIRLSAYAFECDYSYLFSSGEQGLAWCQGLFYCMLNSTCSMEDICVQNFEYAGFAPLMVATSDSQVSLAGTIFTNNVRIPDRIRVSETCSSGLAWIEAADTGALDCVEERTMDSNWTRAEVCSV